ncbi:MAG: IS1595 family transposase [Leptospirales bacterium]
MCLPTVVTSATAAGIRPSLTSGTLFADTKLPLTVWFLAIYLLTQSKNAMSALELKRQLDVSNNIAWLLKHKILQGMKERDDALPLSGPVQIDDASWGGENDAAANGAGRFPGKRRSCRRPSTPKKGVPSGFGLTRVRGFSRYEIDSWARKHLSPDCTVLRRRVPAFRGMTWASYAHQPQVTGGVLDSLRNPAFLWVTHDAGQRQECDPWHLPCRSGEEPSPLSVGVLLSLQPPLPAGRPASRFVYVALRTPPLPYRLGKMAEDHGKSGYFFVFVGSEEVGTFLKTKQPEKIPDRCKRDGRFSMLRTVLGEKRGPCPYAEMKESVG